MKPPSAGLNFTLQALCDFVKPKEPRAEIAWEPNESEQKKYRAVKNQAFQSDFDTLATLEKRKEDQAD